MINKKSKTKSIGQASLFFVTLAVSSNAMAQTVCDAGRYNPSGGNNLNDCILAAPGSFVASSGQTQATPASPGFFVNTSGATTQQRALAGFYVPTFGASAATAVSGGFYTAADTADAQIPAGGLAAPLTAALQSSALFSDMSGDLLDDKNPALLKITTAYQNSSVEQKGLGSGKLDSNIGAVLVQANLLHEKESNSIAGVQLAYGHHNMNNSGNVNNSGDSFEVAAFNAGNFFNGTYQNFALYGQTNYDNRRNVNINAAGTNRETLTASGDISWYGLRSKATYPIFKRIGVVGEIGVLNYSLDAINESGVATSNGSPASSIAALRSNRSSFISAPFTTALSYDIIQKAENRRSAPLTFEVGIIGNLNNEKKIKLTSANSNFAFDLGVNQSSLYAGSLALKLNEFEIADDFHVTGITQMALSSEFTSIRFGVNFVKRW